MVKEYIVGIEKWRIRHLLATLVATYFRVNRYPVRAHATLQLLSLLVVKYLLYVSRQSNSDKIA